MENLFRNTLYLISDHSSLYHFALKGRRLSDRNNIVATASFSWMKEWALHRAKQADEQMAPTSKRCEREQIWAKSMIDLFRTRGFPELTAPFSNGLKKPVKQNRDPTQIGKLWVSHSSAHPLPFSTAVRLRVPIRPDSIPIFHAPSTFCLLPPWKEMPIYH